MDINIDKLFKNLQMERSRFKEDISPIIENMKDKSMDEVLQMLINDPNITLSHIQVLAVIGIVRLFEIQGDL